MLQTIILLAIVLMMFVLGGWMTFFGHRAFRFCGTLFGFALGVGGVLFAAWQLEFAFDSMPILIATPLLGLCLGLLGAFIPIVGAGLGGLGVGYLYGVGAVYSANILLNDAIASILYTGISVLVIVIVFIFCLVKHESAKWFTTSLCGSYTAALGLTIALMWFSAGGFNPTNPALAGSFVTQLVALYGMISSTAKMLMLLFALLFGILGCILQAHTMRKESLDAPLLLDYSATPNDSAPFFNEDALEEESPRKHKRRGRDRDLDLDDQSDGLDVFAARKTRQSASRSEDAAQDEPLANVKPPSIPKPVSQVAAVQQVPAASQQESLDKTQVFRRIKSEELAAAKEAPSAPALQKPAESAAQQRPAAGSDLHGAAPLKSELRIPSAPVFTPRSQRRKGN